MTSTPPIDGRRARSADGRRRVGAALLDLVREQGALPEVAEVARRAGVGRRTVFRYFDGVGALELETARMMRAQITAEHPLPAMTGDLDARLGALVRHRSVLYEWVTPVRRFLDAARAKGNPALDRFVDGARVLLRAQVRQALAPELAGRPGLLLPLEVVTSWETWHTLRRGHRCSVARARREVEGMVRALLAAHGATGRRRTARRSALR